MKKLVIVESPAKCPTIEKYLGKEYEVTSSKGHIRDLATTGKFGLGIDVEHNFEPNYIPIKGKAKTITELKQKAKKSDIVFLATDPDREGEAISWHLFDALGLNKDKYERVVFNEITKDAIIAAFDSPRKIDDNLVKSQETRRMLDRIIGFRLSKLMQSKTGGKSAGRVQSIALKLIVDREREIEAFTPEEYWTIKAVFSDFEASLILKNGKKIEIKTKEEAKAILDELSKSFTLEKIDKKDKTKGAPLPLKTSSLQKLASTKLGFYSSKTMKIAQKLYEGIETDEGPIGLITYMRTDSIRFSDSFVNETFNFIKNNFGASYVGFVKKNKKEVNVQDAHEGIRPTNILKTPIDVKKYLTQDEYKLYDLIYNSALASLMANCIKTQTTIDLVNNAYVFRATGSVIKFDGYLKIYKDYEKNEDVILPNFDDYKSKVIIADDILSEQHWTKPPAKWTESSLINELEILGIGRPSTYATIMETIKTRGYVTLNDKKFTPTEIGFETTDKLQEFFASIVNTEYTAKMEENLDKIAEDKEDNLKILKDFYAEFEPIVESAFKGMKKAEPKATGEECPLCSSPLVIRKGRYGEFTACSNYPTCKYIKKEEKEKIVLAKCPDCDGDIVEKKTKRGKSFYACSNYPKCKFAIWEKPTEEKCPNCNAFLVARKDKVCCSKCDYSK